MSKFKVRITRVETYVRDVEVEAESIEDAIAKAEDNEQDNEYAELFDCPDDVQTSFNVCGYPTTLKPSAKDGEETYRLTELPSIHIDSWVEALANMTGIDKVYTEAHEMAGLEINEDDPICPAEMEGEYTALAEKYDFRFNRKGQIVSYNLNKGE